MLKEIYKDTKIALKFMFNCTKKLFTGTIKIVAKVTETILKGLTFSD